MLDDVPQRDQAKTSVRLGTQKVVEVFINCKRAATTHFLPGNEVRLDPYGLQAMLKRNAAQRPGAAAIVQ